MDCFGTDYKINAHYSVVQDPIDDRFLAPPNIGRIPTKIQSGFSSFIAEQFKNWVIHYSIIALRGLLTSDHLECMLEIFCPCMHAGFCA